MDKSLLLFVWNPFSEKSHLWRKVIMSCFFVFVIGISLKAQSADEKSFKERKREAVQHIKALKNTTLIIQLEKFEKKIQALNELLESGAISDRKKNKIKKDLSRIISSRDTYNLQLQKAFIGEYNFSQILFMYDSDRKLLLGGKTKGIFLGSGMKLDENLTLPDANYYILHTGYTGSETSSGMESLLVSDSDYKLLGKPFPYYYRKNRLSSVIISIFFPSTNIRKDPALLVQKMQEEFQLFYEENVY